VTLTDNKNAFVIVTLWKDGLKGFTITSKGKIIPSEFLKKAKKHLVEDLGFKSNLFYEYSYDECEPFDPKRVEDEL
jgi:hypothetical protein